jgi:hypothetical protein
MKHMAQQLPLWPIGHGFILPALSNAVDKPSAAASSNISSAAGLMLLLSSDTI